MVILFFNLWPFTSLKICPVSHCQSRCTSLPNQMFNINYPKPVKILKKRQIFAKSGHTSQAATISIGQNKMDRFDVLNSVPRFGEISPLWHFFHLVFENILSLLWQIILLCSVGNAEILNKSSSNLVTLVVTLKANLFFPQINSHSFLVISLGTFR